MSKCRVHTEVEPTTSRAHGQDRKVSPGGSASRGTWIHTVHHVVLDTEVGVDSVP